MSNEILVSEIIRTTVDARLEEERELLAKMAEQYGYTDFAKEIRARTKQTE